MMPLKNVQDITPEHIRLRRAETTDSQALAHLLNRCYRSDEGWTNEHRLIGGVRTTTCEIEKIINTDKAYLFVFEPQIDNHRKMLACIGVQFTVMHDKNVAHIGTFAVSPEIQGRGIGNLLLAAVETFAKRHARSHALDGFAVSILSHRPELLAYYERRGYQMTHHQTPFSKDDNHSNPKTEDLVLHWLFKAMPQTKS